MIAAHEGLAQLAATLDHFVRTCAIPDNIAKIYDKIMCRSTRETCIKCLKVGVNIAEQEYAQEDPGQIGDYSLKRGLREQFAIDLQIAL